MEKTSYIPLLVYTQIISCKAIYKLPEYVEQMELKELLRIEGLTEKDLYVAVDKLEELDFERTEEAIFERLTSGKRDRKALLIDVTYTYLVGSQANWRVRKGKDGKCNKLIHVALAVTKEKGFPILHKVYEGSIKN